MSNFILLIACFLLGILFQKFKNLPEKTPQSFNFFIIHISLPAITLLYVPHIQWVWASLLPLLVGALVFGFAYLFFRFVQFFLGFDGKTFACLVLVCGLGNTSFVGFPMIEIFYGKAGLEKAILIDQGTFLTLATLGVALAMQFSQGNLQFRVITQRILLFPPFLAFVFALFVSFFQLPDFLQEILKRLGDTLTPLALVSVGLQIRFQFKQVRFNDLALGLIYKLLFAPFLIGLLYLFLLKNDLLVWRVAILESAMAPMITASILASEYKLNPDLANLLVGIGIPLSFLTVSAWYWILS